MIRNLILGTLIGGLTGGLLLISDNVEAYDWHRRLCECQPYSTTRQDGQVQSGARVRQLIRTATYNRTSRKWEYTWEKMNLWRRAGSYLNQCHQGYLTQERCRTTSRAYSSGWKRANTSAPSCTVPARVTCESGNSCDPFYVACVADADGDLVADARDNCKDVANADQADANADGVGDACTPVASAAPNAPAPAAEFQCEGPRTLQLFATDLDLYPFHLDRNAKSNKRSIAFSEGFLLIDQKFDDYSHGLLRYYVPNPTHDLYPKDLRRLISPADPVVMVPRARHRDLFVAGGGALIRVGRWGGQSVVSGLGADGLRDGDKLISITASGNFVFAGSSNGRILVYNSARSNNALGGSYLRRMPITSMTSKLRSGDNTVVLYFVRGNEIVEEHYDNTATAFHFREQFTIDFENPQSLHMHNGTILATNQTGSIFRLDEEQRILEQVPMNINEISDIQALQTRGNNLYIHSATDNAIFKTDADFTKIERLTFSELNEHEEIVKFAFDNAGMAFLTTEGRLLACTSLDETLDGYSLY